MRKLPNGEKTKEKVLTKTLHKIPIRFTNVCTKGVLVAKIIRVVLFLEP